MTFTAETLAQIRADTRDLIGGMVYDRMFLPGGQTTWVDEGINWACEMVASLLGLTRINTKVAVSSQKSVIPADAIKIVDILNQTTNILGATVGKVLLESTMQVEDWNNPNWKSRTGDPTIWVQQDGGTILLNGTPSTGYILVGYIQRPTAMVNSTDTPDPRIPAIFHQYLKYAAAAYLLTLTGQSQNMDKAAEFFNKFTTGLGVGPLPLASVQVQR